jgi:DNA-directed RNA polymerase subunit RPC12/RpoP
MFGVLILVCVPPGTCGTAQPSTQSRPPSSNPGSVPTFSVGCSREVYEMVNLLVAASHSTAPWYLAVIVIPLAFAAQFVYSSRFDWRCENCGHTVTVSPVAAALSPHRVGGKKYARCPDCGARSWLTPVPKG